MSPFFSEAEREDFERRWPPERRAEMGRQLLVHLAAGRAWSLFPLWAQLDTDAWMTEARGR